MLLFLLFTGALLIRTPFIFLPSLHVDMSVYQQWSSLLQSGSVHFFEISKSDYFPGYLYILQISGLVFHAITHESLQSHTFELVLKFIHNCFDIGTAIFIFLILKYHLKTQKLAVLGSLVYLFNPVTILNSLIWGQSDGVLTFFLIAACYFFIENKKTVLGLLLFVAAIIVKPQSIIIAPLLLLYFKDKKIGTLLLYCLSGIVVGILTFVPFFPQNPILGLVKIFNSSTSLYPFTTIYANNFWQLFGWFTPDQNRFLFLNLQQWGYLLFSLCYISICLPFVKNKTTPIHFYGAVGLSFLAFFLFVTRLHERYLFPALPFVEVAAFILLSKKVTLSYIILSIIHFINICFVYLYLNYTDWVNKSAKLLPFIFVKSKLPPIILVFTFIVLLFEYYKIPFKKKLKK